MKQWKIILAVILFILSSIAVILYFAYPGSKNTVPPEGVQFVDRLEKVGMVDFETKDIYGKSFKLSDYKGKVIILNFWASWCDPCIEEMPSMVKLIDRFKGDVVMVAISADYSMDELTKFLKIFKVTSPHIRVAWDVEKQISSQYLVSALPESFVIGKDFKLVRKIPGSDNWATEDAFLFFESLIRR